MPFADVHFDVTELERELRKLGQDVENIPLSIITEGLITAIDDEIQSEGQGQWPALSDVTLALHPKRIGGRLLQDLGELANLQATEGPDWVEVASPAPYASFHVTGTEQMNIFQTYAPHKMPARNFLDIDIERVLNEAAEAILLEVTE